MEISTHPPPLLMSRRVLGLILLLLCLPGCAWQRVAGPPRYDPHLKFPLNVGATVADNSASLSYGPRIIRRMQEWEAFDSLVYPYRVGDEVDAVLHMAVNGGWRSNRGENFARGFLIGLSFFTLSPVMGARMTGDHSLTASLVKGDNEVFQCTFDKQASVEWGLAADTNEVARKADLLQSSQLALELLERLDGKREQVLRESAD